MTESLASRCLLVAVQPGLRYQGARDGRRVGSQSASDRADRQLRPGQAAPRRALFYGRPGRGFLAAELRYQGARDGRRVGSQAAADRAEHNYARGKLRTLFYGFESAATNDICSTLWPTSISMGPRHQLTNSSHPARGESFVSLLCSTSPFLTIAFSLSPKLKRNEPRITPAFPPHLRRSPHVFRVATSLSLSLFLSAPAFRHSDILRHNVENRRTQGSFSFSFLSSLQTSRGGLLLAESALFTLPSLLFVADSGPVECAIAFFPSLDAFCHLADLRFSFFLPSFSAPQSLSMDFNASPAALQQHPRPAPRSRRDHGARAEDPSPSTGIPAAVLKQALYDSKGTSPRSTRPLPSSRRRTEALRLRQGRRQTSTVEHSPMATTERSVFCCAAMFHQQEGSPSARPRWPRLRQHLSPDLEERRTSRA